MEPTHAWHLHHPALARRRHAPGLTIQRSEGRMLERTFAVHAVNLGLESGVLSTPYRFPNPDVGAGNPPRARGAPVDFV